MRITSAIAASAAVLSLSFAAILPAGAQPAAPPAQAYGKPATMASPSLSPDGEYIAYLAPVDGRQAVAIRKLKPGPGDKLHIFKAPEGELLALTWVNEERLVATIGKSSLVNIPGEDVAIRLTAMFAFNRDGTQELELKGSGILHFVDRETILTQQGADVVALNIYNNKSRTVARSRGVRGGFIPDPSGRVRLAHSYDDRGQVVTYLYRDDPDAAFKAFRQADALKDPPFQILGFGDDPDLVYVASGHEGDKTAVYRFSLSRREFHEKVFSAPNHDVDGALVERGRVVGFTWTDDLPRSHWLDPKRQALQEALDKAVPGSTELVIDQSLDGRRTLVASYSPVEPVAFRLFDRQTKEFSFLGDIYPDIPQEALGARKPVTYAARDGLAIPAYLTLPPGRDPRSLPFIVMPHGGPVSRDDLSFDLHAQFLASRGYAVLQPNFRGSSGYGQAFMKAGLNQWGQKMQEDVTDGVRWAIAQGIADPNRICIVGWSYGGYSALMGSIQDPGLYRCAIATAPVTNLRRLYKELRWTGAKNYIRGLYFDSADTRLESVSPYHLAEKVATPLLIIHGDADIQADVYHSRDMVRALEKSGRPHQYIEVKGMDHSPRTEAEHTKVLEAWDTFLKTHLPAN